MINMTWDMPDRLCHTCIHFCVEVFCLFLLSLPWCCPCILAQNKCEHYLQSFLINNHRHREDWLNYQFFDLLKKNFRWLLVSVFIFFDNFSDIMWEHRLDTHISQNKYNPLQSRICNSCLINDCDLNKWLTYHTIICILWWLIHDADAFVAFKIPNSLPSGEMS